jgi:hypothetical protein
MATPVSMSQGTLVVMRKTLASPDAAGEMPRPGGVRWQAALLAVMHAVRHICFGARSAARLKDLALIDMDPADLSELGRERRRRALEELCEAQRCLGRGPCPDGAPGWRPRH